MRMDFLKDILPNIAGVVFAGFRGFLLTLLWRRFIPSKGKDLCFVGGAAALTGVLFHFITSPIRGGWMITTFLLLIAFCFYRKRSYLREAVFVTILFFNLGMLFVLIMSGMGEILAPLFFRATYAGTTDMLVVEREAGIYQAAFHVICAVILFAEITGVRKISGKMEKMTWTETAYLSVLNVIGIILSLLITDIAVVPLEKDVFILTEERRVFVWMLPVIAVLIYIGELAAIWSRGRYRAALSQAERYFIEKQEKNALQKRLEDTERFYDGIRCVRHEMRGHMANIKGLAELEKYEELDAYIARLDDSISDLEPVVHTGNAVTDVILSDKTREMKEKNIRFSMNFAVDGEPAILIYDLGIVLNNLLANAIESCEKLPPEQRFVELTSKVKGNFLLIETRNASADALRLSEDGLPLSTKTDTEDNKHGYGLRNVKQIAERYYGGITFHNENDTVRVTVMLQKTTPSGNPV